MTARRLSLDNDPKLCRLIRMDSTEMASCPDCKLYTHNPDRAGSESMALDD